MKPVSPLFRPFVYRSVARSRRAVVLAFSLLVAVTVVAPAASAQEPPRCGPDFLIVTVDLNLGQVPTDGDDVILGTPGDDVIAAGAGNDVICAWDGNDQVWGQAGDDQIFGEAGDDKLRGGPGNDLIDGWIGADDVAGGSGNDEVFGSWDDDVVVRGNTGDDFVAGGHGDDPVVAGNGGRDVVDGGFGDDKVTGGPRPDQVYGGWGNDEVKGNGGADYIFGGFGNDDLRGGPQPDDMIGWAGTDDCAGGTTGGGALENDQARCETVRSMEGTAVLFPDGRAPGRLIGEGNLGGPLADLAASGGASGFTLNSPTELVVFMDIYVGCTATDATATVWPTGDGGEFVEVLLFRGAVESLAPGCDTVTPADLVPAQVTLSLSEPITASQVSLWEPPPPAAGQARAARAASFGSFATN